MNLVDLVQQDIALTLRRGEWWGCCPFHEEQTPSFSVNEEKQMYYCFGCEASGDAIEYLRRKRGLSFRDACRVVGREIDAPETRMRSREREVLLDMLQAVDLWRWQEVARLLDEVEEHEEAADIAGLHLRLGSRFASLLTESETSVWCEVYHEAVNGIAQCHEEMQRLLYGKAKEVLDEWQQRAT